MKIEKNLLPILAGMIAMFFWSMMLCIVSVGYGPLGNCIGVHVGHYVIGNVSRYVDPFLLGVLVAFAIFAWQHQPPSFSWNKVGTMSIESEIGAGSLFSVISFVLSVVCVKNYYPQNIPIIFFFYLILLLTPFGLRGVISSLSAITIILWIVYGLPFAMTFFFAVWLGKWAIWWLWNIIWLGFRDTYMKVTRKPSCDHGDEGTDIPQELSF